MESQQDSLGVGLANVAATILNIRDEASVKNNFVLSARAWRYWRGELLVKFLFNYSKSLIKFKCKLNLF